MTNLTVQIFTVKSIAHILLQEENAFFFLITFFKHQIDEHVDDGNLEDKKESLKNVELKKHFPR